MILLILWMDANIFYAHKHTHKSFKSMKIYILFTPEGNRSN